MAIYRKVVRWVHLFKWSDKDPWPIFKATNTPAGFVYHMQEPPPEVVEWLTKRGKMPNLKPVREMARAMSARSVLTGG